MSLLLERLVVDPEGADGVEIDSDGGNLDLAQVEGLGQLLDFTVLCEKAASVVVISGADCSFDVHVDVGTAVALSEFLEHLHLSFQFASLDL